MVTKLPYSVTDAQQCSVLAKIHMVTKLIDVNLVIRVSSVLAKIHMVTKHEP